MNNKRYKWSKLRNIVIVGIVFSIFMMIMHGASWASTTPMIAAGSSHTIALKSDGTVWAWGLNNYGQLGDGTETDRTTPVQVSGLSGVIDIVAGKWHYTIALKPDGTVWTSGYGVVGDDETFTPIQVRDLSSVIAIAGGFDHKIALKSDGTVWAWGGNQGDGTTTTSKTPVQVSVLSGVTAISAGRDYTVALKTDGTVWAWGYNRYGQLGDGTYEHRTTPVQVSNMGGVSAIAGGGYHTVALKSDGTVWVWGSNEDGQLGDGTYTDRTTPVQSVINLLKTETFPCEALSLISETDKVICLDDYYGENGIVEEVWVTASGGDCAEEGVEITATVVGISSISISPKKASTNSNGQAKFKIKVKKMKEGAAKIKFKSGNLRKKIMTVRVMECNDDDN